LQDSTKQLLRAAVVVAVVFLQGCGTTSSMNEGAATTRSEVAEPAPEFAVAAYERALEAMANGETTEAELELEHLILEFPEYAGPYVNLAILYRTSDREDEAEEILDRALQLDPSHPAANNQLGMLLRTRGQFVAAEAAYKRAIAADDRYALAYRNLGILQDLYLNRPADALKNYERYQDLIPEPDATVAGWIIDLRRRLGVSQNSPRIAQEVTQ
jgi:Tfp pilus assembly protein PilF